MIPTFDDDDDNVQLSTQRITLLGTILLVIGMIGFYFIPNMIMEEAEGSRLVNAFYCSVMTLTTVGFGDICPGDISGFGKAFILFLCLGGLGMFCGPIMDLAASWRESVPGGLMAVTITTLAMGVALFTIQEEMFYSEAIYLSIITGTTVGYGDMAPKSDIGKILAALYAICAINVVGAILEPAKDYLQAFCLVKKEKKEKTEDNDDDEKKTKEKTDGKTKTETEIKEDEQSKIQKKEN